MYQYKILIMIFCIFTLSACSSTSGVRGQDMQSVTGKSNSEKVVFPRPPRPSVSYHVG